MTMNNSENQLTKDCKKMIEEVVNEYKVYQDSKNDLPAEELGEKISFYKRRVKEITRLYTLWVEDGNEHSWDSLVAFTAGYMDGMTDGSRMSFQLCGAVEEANRLKRSEVSE